MRLISCIRTAFLGVVAIALIGCSYVSDIFPDKQKNYRYSSELPDLEIPPDMNAPGSDSDSSSFAKLSQSTQGRNSVGNNDTGNASGQAKSATTDTGQAKGRKRKPVKHSDDNVTLAQNMENAALIEIQEPYDEAWNDVGRAIGRLKIEISDQNRSDGLYYVYYGGVSPKKPGAETGFWEDVGSVFSSDKDHAQEFRIKLEDKDTTTNVYIMDQEGKATSDGLGLDLLKKLHDKLITLDQPETPDKPDVKEEEKPAEALD
jgi:uncharacterized lipoprotein